MGDFRKKNILQSDSGGKNLARKYLEKISLTEKISLMSYKAEKILPFYLSAKIIMSPEVCGKKFFTQTKSSNPPLKVKWFTLNAADTTIQLSRGFSSTLR